MGHQEEARLKEELSVRDGLDPETVVRGGSGPLGLQPWQSVLQVGRNGW